MGNRVVEILPDLTVRELAEKLGESPIDVIKELIRNGIMATIDQKLDFDTAAIVGEEMGFEIILFEEKDAEPIAELKKAVILRQKFLSEEPEDKLKSRPPVIAVLGHVDHGKTTLLDAIRNTSVVKDESGGITQHIGAYQVNVNTQKITFLDTPGHAAFTAMRARGAMVTDIVILIVAADDGIMPQTKEAIGHARAANVPIIVAINKIDKSNANPDKVKQELANENLIVEDWGGDVICVPISALNNEGIDELLDNIILAAEVSDFKANPDRYAQGTVIEGRLDKQRGVVATLLVQNGTLKQGDVVVIGTTSGRVRAMFDDKGTKIMMASPSSPISMMGLSEVPIAGDFFEVVKNKKLAQSIVSKRKDAKKSKRKAKRGMSLEDFLIRLEGEEVKKLKLILKADVQGSVEPITSSLKHLGDDEHKVDVILAGTGNITETDLSLALASEAIIVGFNVEIDYAAKRVAESEGVDIRTYNIIYKLVEDIDLALQGLYEPVYQDRIIGHAEVRATFRVGKSIAAGCYISDGKITRNALIRVVRNRKLIHDGTVSSLRHFKDDVPEVAHGYECGIGIENFKEVAISDILEAYVKERVN